MPADGRTRPRRRATAAPRTILGQRLQTARLAAGLTQAQLADAAGAPPRTYQSWELGEAEPRATQLAALAQALGVAVGELVG